MIDVIPAIRPLVQKYHNQCTANALRSRASLQVFSKEGNPENVVTNVDFENTALAFEMLKPFTNRGEALIIEERPSARSPAEVFKSNKPFWVIDPLDGTSQYAKGLASWGFILTRYENGKAVYASVFIPSTGMRLEITSHEALLTDVTGKQMPLANSLPTARGSHANISKRAASLLPMMERCGFRNTGSQLSVAERTISLARGHIALMAFPADVGLWDLAAALMLAELRGYPVFFESSPRELLTVGPHMLRPNWNFRDNLVITSRETYSNLYPALAA